MNKFRFAKVAGILALCCVAGAAVSQAQTFTTVFAFDSASGTQTIPSGLTQAPNGNLVGVTDFGGQSPADGVAYEITPGGTQLGSYNFCSHPACADGGNPYSQLLLASDGNFYGTTSGGGSGNPTLGTIFRITPDGQLTTLYSFCSQANCADGSDPIAPLVEGRNGSLYGTTESGGTAAYCPIKNLGCGTIFAITKSGVFTTLHNFCSRFNCADGLSFPTLTLAQDGNFYGTTQAGVMHGTSFGDGTVFRMSPAGNLFTVHQFTGADGAEPQAVIAGNDGNLYGTTAPNVPEVGGTVFKITPDGQLATLYGFCTDSRDCLDGYAPQAGVIQGNDGNLYGTTEYGGTTGNGTLFQVSPAGQFTTLHNFCLQQKCQDGANPVTALTQYTNGTLYGTTLIGGNPACGWCGTVFNLSMGLTPFVRPNPAFGRIGYTIMIMGNNLTGTTSVTFNGVTATHFLVKSPTLITATVPGAATTGTIHVTTPSGTLSSNVAFQVVP